MTRRKSFLLRLLLQMLLALEVLKGSVHAAGKKYALVIGVQNYDPTQLTSLHYSEADAVAIGESLEKLGFDVIVMTRQASIPERVPATADDILTQIQRRIRDRDPDDTIVIMLSGHGVQLKSDPVKPDGTRESYFCPERTNLNDRSTLLSLSQVVSVFQECKAGRKLLLVDACRNEVEPKAVADKGGSPVTIELDPAGVTRRTIPQGMVALFSCSPKERSFEMSGLSHSVFSYHVLQYLEGKADDNRYPDGELRINEMATFVSRETRDYIDRHLGKDQTPELLLPNGRLTDWPLGKMRELAELITNSIGMKLKLIPAGEFMMGSSDADVAAAIKADAGAAQTANLDLKEEGPQHRVKITRSFYAGVYEVTQSEYVAVMGTNPSFFTYDELSKGIPDDNLQGIRFEERGEVLYLSRDEFQQTLTLLKTQGTSNFPVESLSWYDAIEFCNKLSKREGLQPYYAMTSIEREDRQVVSAVVTAVSGGRQSSDTAGYRLPTEAEWEYMCRAGTKSAYWFGNVLNGDKANVAGLVPFGTLTTGSYLSRPAPVGSYDANPFGLFDTHGNVSEFCEDMYDENAYRSRRGVTVNPLSTSGSDYRVERGGSWEISPMGARSANRGIGGTPAHYPRGSTGLRVVR